jgi:hypothetical protein
MAAWPHSDDGISADPSFQQVVLAESALTHTWQRLNALRQAAYYAGRYDSEEYGHAVAAYREAERSLRAARGAWVERQAAPPASGLTLAPVLHAPEEHLRAA